MKKVKDSVFNHINDLTLAILLLVTTMCVRMIENVVICVKPDLSP